MRYTVTRSIVQVIGPIWMPATTAATQYELSPYDVENVRAYKDEHQTDWRGGLEQWLTRHAGDFQHVTDFYASLEYNGETIGIEWADEESELTFNDCMFPDED